MEKHLPFHRLKEGDCELNQRKLVGNSGTGFQTHVRLMSHGHFHSFKSESVFYVPWEPSPALIRSLISQVQLNQRVLCSDSSVC